MITGNLLRFSKTRNKLIAPKKNWEKVKDINIKEYLSTLYFSLLGYRRINDEHKINMYENILRF